MNTGRKHIMNQIFSPFALALILGIIIVTSGCGEAAPAASQDALQKQEEIEKELTEGNVVLSGQELSTYGSIQSCQIQEDQETVSLMLEMPDIPKSDDPMVYLFAFDLYETCEFDEELDREPVASTQKSTESRLQWNYESGQLFQQFVPALRWNGKYVPLCAGICIGNPEMLADSTVTVPKPESKKGLLLDPQMLETPMLTDLDVKYAIYNIPLSHIMGETANPQMQIGRASWRERVF